MNQPRPAASKICSSLEEAVKRSGLADGGTISFHHHFREGDQVMLAVVAELARLGLRDLTLAPSSLGACHAGLIEFIRRGVITQIYTSGLRGQLAEAVSHGLMDRPVQLHSHGGRCALIQSGEIKIDVAFLGVSACDRLGNANGVTGRSPCGSLGYAQVDAQHARGVVLVTEQLVDYPNQPASIRQDQVDWIVQLPAVGDPAKISSGAARVTTDPRELLIARHAAEVMAASGLFVDGFSLQTGSGAAAIATTRHLRRKMAHRRVKAAWALGGITADIVELAQDGWLDRIVDVQDFDVQAAEDLRTNPRHHEISAAEYANPIGKGACVDELDLVILSALEVDLDFNVNVLTGSDGVMRGASGGHCDTAAGAKLAIVVAPLLRSRIPTVVRRVTTKVTPGRDVGVLVTDAGIAVNPDRPELAERLRQARLPVVALEDLHERSLKIAGRPRPLEFDDKVVGVVRYRDGSILDTVRQVA
ncbi:MAG: citrate lyase subunit alpha, partial [Propionibacteriaceae bacterium]|nr:citrate lyase subunit alpha [Propionibacteriaceae bacterium]